MNIGFDTIRKDIKRHLAIIGKRMYTKEGNNLFSNITTSTAEAPIFNQYISAAAQDVEALLRILISAYNATSTEITLTLRNTRGTSDFDSRCKELITTYIVLFSVGEYLAMAHPELTEKYRADAASSLQTLALYAFHKEPPAKASVGYDDINGTTR